MRMKSKRESKIKYYITAVVTLTVLLVFALTQNESIEEWLSNSSGDSFHYTKGTVAVHFIDVGQGSSTLIQSGTEGILIDAGEREYADTVIDYIRTSGVKSLKYVIASHPHSDHIGALPDLLNAIPAENIIMPRLSEINTPTTSTYERLLKTIQKNKIKAIAASYGQTYGISNAQFEILGPLVQDESLNNMSVVCKLKAFDTSFLLLADADKDELRTIYDKGAALKCDVLFFGHHGSSKALYKPFLNAANASIGVISCGKNNDYGHPHREILQYIDQKHMTCYRTDLNSHIVFVCSSDGYDVQTAA